MHIKPLHDRVVIRRLAAETTSKGGIVIPDQAAEKSSQGEVIAIGEGLCLDNGQRQPLSVQIGDRVLFAQYAGTEVKLDGTTYLVIKETDILAVVETAAVQEKAA